MIAHISNARPREPRLLGLSRIHVESRGRQSYGEAADSLAVLMCRLERYTLNPMFERYGTFVIQCRGAAFSGFDPNTCKHVCIDTGPIYADAPYAVRFFGNFYDLSAVFQVDTDDAEVIEVVLGAIRANQQSPTYTEARQRVFK
jgi:hypothetical protein